MHDKQTLEICSTVAATAVVLTKMVEHPQVIPSAQLNHDFWQKIRL